MNQRNFLILFFVVCTFYSHQAAGNHYFSDDNKEIVDYEDVTTLKPSIRKNSEFLTTLRPQINIVSTEVSTVYRSPEISTRTTINDIEEGGRVEEINYSSGNTN
ncbi:hypothetical protein PVAND_015976 [Polypedilum vanderplanki]|uniref:Uncharacterized protein n=1 Tax=Polypedilum vanderplanki TaxID=319348 RepID=A0A9J6BEU8_POLVA|nr:hypothetical protein PVAND_015976 [Polypedilum vanderplanki]